MQVQGVSRDYVSFSTFDAERGRLDQPVRDRPEPPGASCWRTETADRLFGPADPLDKTIKIAGRALPVVGVSKKKGSVFGQSQDEFAIIPLGAFQKIFGSRPNMQFLVKPRTPEVVKAAMDDATVAMRVQRRLGPKEPDNFGMFTSDTLLNIYHTATNGIFAVLVGVVALSLVVGGIVIMNIMLMVVTERTREIGLRKALGARRRDIIWQILTESVTLSVFGGMVGIILGFGLALADQQSVAIACGRPVVGGLARPRHHRHGRPVLRALPGDAGRSTRPDRSAEARVTRGCDSAPASSAKSSACRSTRCGRTRCGPR